MDTMLYEIEQTALRAWPALCQLEYDGWLVRFSDGYTKRANSVTPLPGSTLPVEQKIAHCEQLYAGKGLPCIFRLTPFASPTGLDDALARRGYTVFDTTLVMLADLKDYELPGEMNTVLSTRLLDDWLDIYCDLRGQPLASRRTHQGILECIEHQEGHTVQRLLVSLDRGTKPVSCAMGVIEDGYLGLFDMITAVQERNRGYGHALLSSLFCLARERGAAVAYLQVVEQNARARRLYSKLGFQEAYRYWYRMPPGQ
jgi:GNAT superfamily N-acetyltransferase